MSATVESAIVEMDALYVVAGHRGQPGKVKEKGSKARRGHLKGKRGRVTKESEKPPVPGMIERNGLVNVFLLDNVKVKTIKLLLQQ